MSLFLTKLLMHARLHFTAALQNAALVCPHNIYASSMLYRYLS